MAASRSTACLPLSRSLIRKQLRRFRQRWKLQSRNLSCTADIVMGMYADSYYFAGGFDDWFYETDSDLTIDDLEAHFLSGLLANGADVDSSVDAISNLGSVTLKQTDGVYAESGVLYTRILDLGEGGLAGAGKIQLVGTVDAGITSISEVRTRTSDSLEDTSFQIGKRSERMG